MRATTERTGLILLILTLMGFGLRLAATQIFTGGLDLPLGDNDSSSLGSDETDYTAVARNVLAGRGYSNSHGPTSQRTPGLPLLIGIVFEIFGDRVVPLRMTMCLIGAMIVPAIYLLGRALLGVRAGLLAALVGAVFPSWVYASGSVMTDVPASVLVCIIAWLLIRTWQRDSLWLAAAAGLLAGFTTLVRPTAIVFFGTGLVWLLISMKNWPRRLSAALVLVAAFGAIISPWSVRNYYAQGRLVLISSKGGGELWKSTNPYATGINSLDAFEDERIFFAESLPEIERSLIYKEAALKFMREHPRRVLELAGIKFVQFWKVWSPRVSLAPNLATLASFGPVLVLFLIGAVRYGWQRGPDMLLVLMIAGLTALHMLFTSTIRYRVPIEPLCIILALKALGLWFESRRRDGEGDRPARVKLGAGRQPLILRSCASEAADRNPQSEIRTEFKC